MGIGPKTKNRRPKIRHNGDEDYLHDEDIIGKAMVVKAAKKSK